MTAQNAWMPAAAVALRQRPLMAFHEPNVLLPTAGLPSGQPPVINYLERKLFSNLSGAV